MSEPTTGPSKRTLGIALGVAGAVVLVLVIALVVALTAGSAPAPAPTPSPSTSAPTPSPTPGTPAQIRAFSAQSNTATCSSTAGLVQVSLTWDVANAAKIAVASAKEKEDAIVHPFENNLPAKVERFSIPFSCGVDRWSYTLSAVGTDGVTVSQVVTVTRDLATPKPTPSPTPTPKPTPTPPKPTPTPTPTPDPPAPAPYIVSFTATPDQISCEAGESFELSWDVANVGADDSVILAVHVKENVVLLNLPAQGSVTVPSDELAGFCDGQEEFYWLSVTDGKTFADRQGIQVINLDDPPLIQG